MKTFGLVAASWLFTLALSYLTIRYGGDCLLRYASAMIVFHGAPSAIMALSFGFFYRVFTPSRCAFTITLALLSLIILNCMIWSILSGAEF